MNDLRPAGRPVHQGDAPGWTARLELGFAARGGRTVLVHRRHQGPLRVQRPFYPEGSLCHLYLVHPPGGIVGGDDLDLSADLMPGAEALLTTPAAGKFYRSNGRDGVQTAVLRVHDATLEWLPQETLFFPGCAARQQTRISLHGDARLIAWEIACYGLPARDPGFTGRCRQRFEVWRDDRPLLLDHLRVDADNGLLGRAVGHDGQPVLGTFVAYPFSPPELEALREAVPGVRQDGQLGLSCVDGLLVGRLLAGHVDSVQQRFRALWAWLRPRLLGRSAQAPRIWAT